MENEKEQRVLEAAKVVFLRYGFRRVTMQDIAHEAGISRPALYFIFANKEEVFKAAARQMSSQSLAEIRAGLPGQPTVREQLEYAFELWTIRPFGLLLSSPDARDLVSCTQGFAKETMDEISAEFESVLVQILHPLVDVHPRPILSARQIAHLLSASAHGYKDSTSSVAELRQMIADLIALTLAALTA